MKSTDLNFGLALRECRIQSGMSQEELALESNLDRTYISMLERNIKVPTLTTVNQIAKALHMKPTTLLGIAENKELLEISQSQVKKDKLKFPFMGTSVSCGLPITSEYVVEKEISLEDYLIKNPQRTFFVKASGVSMTPIIQDGDLLVVELSSKVKNGDIVIAQVGSDFTVKRYFKVKNEIKLSPENPLFKEISSNQKVSISVCGVVTGLLRNI